MKELPQLRVRTEYSFGAAFGPTAEVAGALVELGAPAAGMVDGGTWGHVRWAKELAKTGVRPLFGTELSVALPDGRKPVAWALAADFPGFYALSSAARRPDADVAALFASAKGSIRFAGAALEDPECFDYVDLNPGSPLQQRRAVALARRTKKPLVITSDNAYPLARHKAAYLAHVDRQQVTPQHLLGWQELRASLAWIGDPTFKKAARNTIEAAERCATKLPTAPIINVAGNLNELAAAGALRRIESGRIKAWTPEYEARMARELAMIAQKQYESYFIVVADLVRWAKTQMLVGPARGSSAGSLVCFCLGITEVDPIPHGLLFERFIDITRADLPDIDIDFNDQKREAVFDYLADKYGREHVARIGSINTLKPRSVMARVCKKLGIPDHEKFDVMNVLIEYSSGDSRYGKGLEDTLRTTEPGRRFAIKYPESSLMGLLENHASHTGVHAAGVIVCNDRISDYATVGPDGVAQIDKSDAGTLNLLKIDALGLRTLGVIEDAGVVDAETLYGLTLDDPEVFRIFNERRYAGIFQFEGNAQQLVASEIEIKSFREIDHCTALSRPGPLGGGAAQHYIERAAGREPVTFQHPSMSEYLAPTMGVVLYQEQVMRICFELGMFPWETVSEIRKAMSGSKGKEYFDRRGSEFLAGCAKQGIAADDAQVIWDQICTFGAWGMNASHTVSYSIISYWCAWMKRYHPLEYAAASMRGAKDDEHALSLLRDIVKEGIEYVAFDVERSQADWRAIDGKLVGGFQNLVGIGPTKAKRWVELRDGGRLTPEHHEKLAKMEIKFKELFPLAAAYGGLYDDPEAYGCAAGSVVLRADEFPERGNVLWLCKLLKKVLRDENEALRIGRRGGKKMDGQTLFADLTCTDDTGNPIIVRIDRFNYNELGRIALDNLQVGDVLLVRGRRIPNFSMLKVERMKCITRPEALR